jgi:hypothetical protein
MAAKTQEVAQGPYFAITVTFDDVTGAISRLDWTVAAGVLTVTISQTGKADIVRTMTTAGGINVPPGQGYTLTLSSKGMWVWTGALGFEMNWSSS